MHEIEFRLGASLQTHWGDYNAPQNPQPEFGKGEERNGKGGERERSERRRRRKGRGGNGIERGKGML